MLQRQPRGVFISKGRDFGQCILATLLKDLGKPLLEPRAGCPANSTTYLGGWLRCELMPLWWWLSVVVWRVDCLSSPARPGLRSYAHDAVLVEGSVVTHLTRNKRLLDAQSGFGFRIFNARYGEWLASVESVESGIVVARVMAPLRAPPPEARAPVNLLLAPTTQQQRLRFAYEKATELGVVAIRPVRSARKPAKNHHKNHQESISTREEPTPSPRPTAGARLGARARTRVVARSARADV